MNTWMSLGLVLLVVVAFNHSIVQVNGRGSSSNQRVPQHSIRQSAVYNLADLSHLTVRSTKNGSNSDEYSEGNDNCTNPRNPPQKYKSSCEFVHDECASKAELIDYMAFVVCSLSSTQVSTSSS
jgi:hypothetical protein